MRVGVFLAISVLCSTAQANFIQNGDFESLVIGPSFAAYGTGNTSGLPNWTVTGSTCNTNCVTVLKNTYTEGSLVFQAENGSQSVDLTGQGNTVDGGLQQTVTGLTPGLTYRLSFWLGNQDDTSTNYPLPAAVVLFLDGNSQGAFVNAFTSVNQVFWQMLTLDFQATASSTVIAFRNATGTADNYTGLDNVSLDVVPDVAAPEPSTFALFGIAAGALALFRRR